MGGSGILYMKEISDYQNSPPELRHKRGIETGKAEWDTEMKTLYMASDNEGREFKETKQKKKKKKEVRQGSRGVKRKRKIQ